ncbi:MAG: 8-oxo-dGTP diphosphatase, partial [Actinomycetota bacterium]|nr:8-oxo-dGTP diphosphatase [Actinomycetota bacterium]
PVLARVMAPSGDQVRLAFDHVEILGSVIERLRNELWTTDISLRFLGQQFTLRALQDVFEAILGRALNKDSFRRRVVHTFNLVAPTGELETGVSHRPAELYKRASDAGQLPSYRK